jgi:Wzt C-terminal domain
VTLDIRAVDGQGSVLPSAVPGCDLLIHTEVRCVVNFANANVAVTVFDNSGYRVVDINTALRGDSLTLKSGERASVTFHVQDVLLKPGMYYVALWLGRGGIESIDHIESAAVWDVQEDSTSRHTEVFPGVYQCRFTHTLVVHQRDDNPESRAQDQMRDSAGILG